MKNLFPKLSRCFCALVLLAAASSAAFADIVVVSGAKNQGTKPVLLNDGTDVLTVTGTIYQSGSLVNFTSSSGSGLLSSVGQAVVGGTGNTALTQVTFGRADNGTFTRAVFNLNAATAGAVIIHVEGVNITGGFFEDDFVVGANGQNFFTVDAINGQAITSVSLTLVNGATLEGLRQVRIG